MARRSPPSAKRSRVPGFDSEVQGYLTAKVEEGLTGVGDPVVVSIQGPEQEGLRREAEKVAQILSGIAGIANLRVENPVETPQVAIKVDPRGGRSGRAEAGRCPAARLPPSSVALKSATCTNSRRSSRWWSGEYPIPPEPHGSSRAPDRHAQRRPRAPGGCGRGGRGADAGGHRPRKLLPPRRHPRRRRGTRPGFRPGGRRGTAARQWNFRSSTMPCSSGTTRRGRRPTGRPPSPRWPLPSGSICCCRRASELAVRVPVRPGLLGRSRAACWRCHRQRGGTASVGSLAGLLAVLGVAARHGLLLVSTYRSLEQHEGEALGPELVLRGARQRVGSTVTSATAIGAPSCLSWAASPGSRSCTRWPSSSWAASSPRRS